MRPVFNEMEVVGEEVTQTVQSVSYGFIGLLFFFWVGLNADLEGLFREPTLAILLYLAGTLGKLVGVFLMVPMRKLTVREAWTVGIGLDARLTTEIIVARLLFDARLIDGGSHVVSVTLEGGEKIPADMVLISIGAKPASELAQKAGLRIVDNDSIWVDDYMRTEAEEVFAVGDCALKRDFFTRRAVPVWLASTATAEARNAGTNLYGIRVLHQIQGTIAAFSTKIGGVSFASTGMTCRTCEKEGFRYISTTAVAPDRHPGKLPGAHELKLKLVFADRSGIILGGQISGGASVGELINTIALAIQKKVSVRELDMMQIATHPLLTSAPTIHPLVNGAHQALAKLRTGKK